LLCTSRTPQAPGLAWNTEKNLYLLKNIFLFRKTSIDLSLVACLVSFHFPQPRPIHTHCCEVFFHTPSNYVTCCGCPIHERHSFGLFLGGTEEPSLGTFSCNVKSMVESTCLTCEPTDGETAVPNRPWENPLTPKELRLTPPGWN